MWVFLDIPNNPNRVLLRAVNLKVDAGVENCNVFRPPGCSGGSPGQRSVRKASLSVKLTIAQQDSCLEISPKKWSSLQDPEELTDPQAGKLKHGRAGAGRSRRAPRPRRIRGANFGSTFGELLRGEAGRSPWKKK
ncbi:hypothetical protein Bbelb_207830 [Branchiostoma belcheri]|nr:hypothetical protein Bbelb_207830 [Branchiostoma belcheri]